MTTPTPHPDGTAPAHSPLGRPPSHAAGWDAEQPSRPTVPSHLPVPLDDATEKRKRLVEYVKTGFYGVVLMVALAGQVTGAMERLGLPWFIALPGVAAPELGAIVILAQADVRRRIGEAAIGYRVLSAGIAAFAVTFNWLAHADHLLGGFFSGMSLLGYLVWLMSVEDQRRDRQREIGHGAQLIPAYPWRMRLRHPQLVARARLIARQTIEAGGEMRQQESLTTARAAIAEDRRIKVIADVVSAKLKKLGKIASELVDANEVARKLAAGIDLDALVVEIAADLDVTMLAAAVKADVPSRPAVAVGPPSRPKASRRPVPSTAPVPSHRAAEGPSRPVPPQGSVPSHSDPSSRPTPRPAGGTVVGASRPNGNDAAIDKLEAGDTLNGTSYPDWRVVPPSIRAINDALGFTGNGTAGRIRARMVNRTVAEEAGTLAIDLAHLSA